LFDIMPNMSSVIDWGTSGTPVIRRRHRTMATQRARSGGSAGVVAIQRLPSVRLLSFLVALGAVFLLIGGAAEADQPAPEPTAYVVQEGDTLWSIAAGVSAGGADLRAVVAQIKSLTGVESSTLVPGQILQLPTG
jgi:hypothetical protein